MLVKREVILAKIEGTYNSDPTPTNTDNSILVEDPSWAHEGLRMIDRNPVRPNLAPLRSIYGGTLKQIKFGAELKGPGIAYSASVRPEIDPLLRACGLSPTIVTTGGSESATYKPISTAIESVTIYYYQDGTLHKLTGARGNVDFSMEAGSRVMANFTFTGHDNTVTDTSLVTPTYDSTVPPVFLSAGFFTHSDYAAIISGLKFDMGNKISTPPSVNAADGYGETRITGRSVTGSFDPENVLVATHPFIANLKAGTLDNIGTGVIAGAQYNRFAITFPAIFYRDVSPGDRDGIRTLEVPFGAVESSGDDEVSIAFT
jgi:hypothetical protein